jgi:hypothetical protein
MRFVAEHHDPIGRNDRIGGAEAVTADLMAEIIGLRCRQLPPIRRTEKTARIERLIGSGAWTDAALALIDLELPQWQVRRIAYDAGEWHCALSRQRELPEWLDQSIESHHADVVLAILSAFLDVQHFSARTNRTSVPTVPRNASPLYPPVCCDNFS